MSIPELAKTSCKPSALSKIVKKDKARILVQVVVQIKQPTRGVWQD